VLFNFYIEGLRFHIHEGWVVDTWNGLGGHQVMKVAGQLSELGTCCLLLTFLFLHSKLTLILRELLPDLFILGLDVI
jgi:hypothetical protein